MLRGLFLILALGAASPVRAQQAPISAPQTEPAADALEAARELLRSAHYDEQFAATARQSAEASFAAVTDQLQQQYQDEFPEELRTRFRDVMRQHIEQVIVDMRPTALDDAARVYARYFTAAELRELQDLQSQPVLVKMQRIAPQFMADLTRIGVEGTAHRLPQLIQQMTQIIEDWRRRLRDQPAR